MNPTYRDETGGKVVPDRWLFEEGDEERTYLVKLSFSVTLSKWPELDLDDVDQVRDTLAEHIRSDYLNDIDTAIDEIALYEVRVPEDDPRAKSA